MCRPHVCRAVSRSAYAALALPTLRWLRLRCAGSARTTRSDHAVRRLQHLVYPLHPAAARLEGVRPRRVVHQHDRRATLVCGAQRVRPAHRALPAPAALHIRGRNPLGAGRTFHRLGSISVKRSCPPVSKRCSSTLTSESGMGTCFEQNSAPHVIWYVFGNFAPEELNICTRAVLPTAGSPACAARAHAITKRRAGRWLGDDACTTGHFAHASRGDAQGGG